MDEKNINSDPKFRRKVRQVVSVADILPQNLKLLLREEDKELYFAAKVVAAWRELIGQNLAAYSCMESFDDGVLKVRITSAPLRNELFMQKSALVKKLNEKLERNWVKMITFI